MISRKYVIIDIDGTIASVHPDRLKYLQQENKDWDTFYQLCFKDDPIPEILDLVQTVIYSNKYKIVFCTGRRDTVEQETRNWLNEYFEELGEYILLMRKDRDWRHDTAVKPELLAKSGINTDNVAFILEDRDSMVTKWRELGYKCLQVADGNF